MKQAVCWLAARLSRLSLLVASGSDSVALVFWGRNPPRWAGLLVPVLRWGGLVGPRESATMVRAPAGLSRGVLGEPRREFEPHAVERARLLVRREAADFAGLRGLLDGGSEMVRATMTRHRLDPLKALAQVVDELDLVAAHSLVEFREGVYARRAAERLVQLAVDLACEVGLAALSCLRERLPNGYEETFRELGKAGVLDGALAEKMASAVAIRRGMLYSPSLVGNDDFHRRLPFVAVLMREYGKRMEEWMERGGGGR